MKGRDALFSHKSDEYSTPQWLFDHLNLDHHFTLDPCATPENAKCKKFYTKEQDGLKQSWTGESVFVNPPYSNIGAWALKCADEAWGGPKNPSGFPAVRTVVDLLIPARTDTKYFHKIIHRATRLIFIAGRLKFGDTTNSAPFPSMVVEFDVPNWMGYCTVSTLNISKSRRI